MALPRRNGGERTPTTTPLADIDKPSKHMYLPVREAVQGQED